ncbi:hypothetical protein [Arthrobacter sp. ISL-5]|uniref:hypothetical protein n=1 Tax=Arthrobacter sp. ISL-5 TaxID=2819111 RepID=UPI001BE4F713|nr:hypothetical protein [Arthrobacter sp. ISL-5]MBT2556083.1 hypothetical protein [Arthrobacter sp. ISL-5]
MKMHTRATAALVMTCGLGLFAAAAPAAAANEVLDISDGTLLAKGIGFQISYTYTCDPGLTATSAVDVVQRISKSQVTIAVAGDASKTECTGNPQTLTFVGQTKPGYLPLKSGVALATVTVNLSNDQNQPFQNLRFAKEIRLTNK